MSPLDVFLSNLLGDLLPERDDPSTDASRIEVTSLHLTLPVETRVQSTGAVDLSLPRGRMQTGFSLPHGRLTLRLEGAG